MKTGGDKTKQRLLLEALKLFTVKQYDQVTYTDLEKATGLSRGAILYHIKSKENLFRDVVSMFVFRNNTLTALTDEQKKTLKSTIDNFMDLLAQEQKHWTETGIQNLNFALVNVELSAFIKFPDTLVYGGEWYRNECNIWREVLDRAIASGEIHRVDTAIFSELIEDAYLGAAYAGLPQPTGYNVERVRHKLLALYNSIAKNM